MALLDDEIKKFTDEQAELGCWNQDFEYRLRRALIRYHTIQSKELRERVKELEESKAQDLSFLIEIRDRFKKSHLDVVQREYVEQMLSDWIAELGGKK